MNSSKTLFVLRHAKSSWDETDKRDIDRPLNSRGINNAHNLANALRDELIIIDAVVSSPANRAIHTSIIFCQVAELPLEIIQLNEKLYDTNEDEVERIVRAFSDDINSVMIVGHNPAFTYFANRYALKSIKNIPTSGIVKLEFEVNSWNDISRSNVKSSSFDFPKNH
jgi:phosphohistidine phosphatase